MEVSAFPKRPPPPLPNPPKMKKILTYFPIAVTPREARILILFKDLYRAYSIIICFKIRQTKLIVKKQINTISGSILAIFKIS